MMDYGDQGKGVEALPDEPETGKTLTGGFTAWMKQLWRYCRSLQLSGDSKFLLIRHTSIGTSVAFNPAAFGDYLSAAGGGGGGSAYAGQFMLKSSTEDGVNYLEVVDGSLDDDLQQSNPAGLVNVGGVFIAVDSMIEDEITPAAGVVYLLVDYEYVDDAATPTYTAEIKLAATLPAEYVDGAWTVVKQLGTYALTTSGDTSTLAVIQTWTGGMVYLTDRVQP